MQDRIDKNVRLSGYGVELQMKSTEYKATDDSDIKDNAGKTQRPLMIALKKQMELIL